MIYRDMKHRCHNKNNERYKDYGERGITIYNEWLGENGFINFYNWAMNNGYEDHLSIDRIDVDGNYDPNNCKWSNNHEQSINKRTTRYVTINGETKALSEWAKIIGISQQSFASRLKSGWDEDRLLSRKKIVRADKQSGVVNVNWWKKENKWEVKVKGVFVGYFKELEDAIEAKNKYLNTV